MILSLLYASLEQTVSQAGVIISLGVGAGGFASFTWAYSKVKGIQTTVDLLAAARVALEATLESERKERQRESEAAKEQAALERANCDKALARMQGQLDAMTGSLGAAIATAAVTALATVGAHPGVAIAGLGTVTETTNTSTTTTRENQP